MTVSSGANTVFGWFVNLTTVGGFIGWGVMNWTYLAFCASAHSFQEMTVIHVSRRLRVQEAGVQQEGTHLLRSLSAVPLVVGYFLDDILHHHLRPPDVVQVGYFHLLYIL